MLMNSSSAYYGCYETDQDFKIVLEFMAGGNLQAVLSKLLATPFANED